MNAIGPMNLRYFSDLLGVILRAGIRLHSRVGTER